MAQDLGAAEPIRQVFKRGYDKIYGLLGDPSKPVSKPKNVMDDIPKDNPNRKAWEEATKFTAKGVGTKTASKKQVKPGAKKASAKKYGGKR